MTPSGLGRGLAALIPQRKDDAAAVAGRPSVASLAAAGLLPSEGLPSPRQDHAHRVLQVPISDIDRNPEQPRSEFSELELQDLAQSIRARGILQPLIVTREGSRYTIIAGERRLRAAKRAGLTEVPCLVHDSLTSRERLELALIENVQRADLNPLEQAIAYKRLHEEFELSHEDIARAVGKERPSISNMIRLLDLPEDMQQALRDGRLSFGQGRGLLAIKDPAKQREAFQRLLTGDLTKQALERETRRVNAAPHTRQTQKDPQLALSEQELGRALGTRVRIKKIGDGGSIEIEYYSAEELTGIVERLNRSVG